MVDLLPGRQLASYGISNGSHISLSARLRGGSSTVHLTVQPRLQKEKWSLYWKETMSTKTICLDPIELDVDENTTIAEASWRADAAHVATLAPFPSPDGLPAHRCMRAMGVASCGSSVDFTTAQPFIVCHDH